MSTVNANINITVDSSQALSQIRALQSQINAFNRTAAAAGGSAATQMTALNKALADTAAASGMFNAKIVPTTAGIDKFSQALDRGKLSLSEYTRGAASQLPGFSRVFQKEFDTITKVAEQRIKTLQTQFTALGNSQKALALEPTALDMRNFSTQAALAAQKQMIFNKMIDDGSTKLVNWGKNTQWAGRQLMVGFSMPLALFGATAAKVFMDLDKQARDFKRVYGDAFTPPAEIEQNLKSIEGLAKEYTKYGITVADSMKVAATAAAAGMRNEKLMAGTEEALRLATIGQIDYNQALDTTISLQTAFKMSAEDLAPSVDYLGAVANQTVLTIDDMTKAIPRVAPVVEGLGGDVKDLAAMLVAMREGGVSAENAANGLKSGLASLINPTNAARGALSKLGIDIDSIVQANKGDLMGTITDFATALSKLGDFERQQALEKTFGKYQYARLGALFDNIIKKGSQASVALDLAGKSAEELGALSAKSLNEIEQSTTAKFQGALERLKVSIAPVGEAFLKALTPIIEFVTKIAEKFNSLPDNVKNVIAIIVGVIGGLGPIVLMTVGLIANGIGNLIKVMQLMRKGFARIKGDASAFSYLESAELEAAAAAASLEGRSTKLTESLLLQEGVVARLAGLYERLAGSAAAAAASMPTMMGMAVGGGRGRSTVSSRGRSTVSRPMGMATGGVVPGTGSGDKIPALLEPGETVITKEASQSYAPVLAAMNAGTLPGYEGGVLQIGTGEDARTFDVRSSRVAAALEARVVRMQEELGMSLDEISQSFERLGTLTAATVDEQIIRPLQQELRAARQSTSTSISGALPFSYTPSGMMLPGNQTAFGADRALFDQANENSLASNSQLLEGVRTSLAAGAANLQEFETGAKITSEQLTALSQTLGPDAEAIEMALQESASELRKAGTPAKSIYEIIENARGRLQTITDEMIASGDTSRRRAAQFFQLGTINPDEEWAKRFGEQRVSRTDFYTATGEKAKGTPAPSRIGGASRHQQLSQQLMGNTQGLQYAHTNDQLFLSEARESLSGGLITGGGSSAGKFATQQQIITAQQLEITELTRLVESGRLKGIAASDVSARVSALPAYTTALAAASVSRQAALQSDDQYSQGLDSELDKPDADPYVRSRHNRNSPHPLTKIDGRDDALSYSAAVKRAIMGEGRIPELSQMAARGAGGKGGTGAKTRVGGADGFAAENAALIRSQILSGKEISKIRQRLQSFYAEIEPGINQIKKGFNDAFQAIGTLVKTTLLPSIKEPLQIIANIMKQIAEPYVRPVINAAKAFAEKIKSTIEQVKQSINNGITKAKTFIDTNVKNVKDFFNNGATKIKDFVQSSFESATKKIVSAYETVALKSMAAFDKLKAIPAKLTSAYETSVLKLLYAFDKVKAIPGQLQAVATRARDTFTDFKEKFNDLSRRTKTRAFYGAQDLKGRVAERVSSLRDRLRGARDAASTAAQVAINPVPRTIAMAATKDAAEQKISKIITNVTEKTQQVINTVTQKVQSMMETIAIKTQQFVDIAKTKIMQSIDQIKGAAIQTRDLIVGKVTSAIDTVKTKITEGANLFKEKVDQASAKIMEVGSKVANSLQVAGMALANRDPKTALRALIPDNVAKKLGEIRDKGAQKLTAIRDRGAEIYAAGKQRVGDFVTQAKPTAITAYNALLAGDIKTFIKALTPDKVQAAVNNLTSSIVKASKLAYQTIVLNTKALIKYGPGIVKDAFSAAKTKIIESANAAFTSAQKYITDGFNKVKTNLINAGISVKQSFDKLVGLAKTGLDNAILTIKLNLAAAAIIVKDSFDKVVTRIQEVAVSIKTKVTNEITRIRGILREEGPKLKASLRDGVTNIKDGITTAGVKLKDAIVSVASGIASVGRGVGGIAGAGVSGAVGGIKGWLQATNEQGVTRMSRLTQGANNAAMGLMGVSMAASMVPGPMGEMAQKMMPVTMGLASLQMIIPMLTNPLGLLILAATGLAAGYIYLRKQIDDAAKKAAILGANLGGVANGMKIIEEATGFKIPSGKDRLFRFTEEDKKAMAEFGSYFESEGGAKFIEELKSLSSEDRYKKVARLLAQAIGSGLEEEKAKAFGYAIAEATGDALLKSSIARDFANQIFKSGSQALIDLETTRMSESPKLPERPDYSNENLDLGIFGLGNYGPPSQSVSGATTRGAATGAAIGGIAATLGVTALGLGTGAVAAAPTVVGGITLGAAAATVATAAAIMAAAGAVVSYKEAMDEQTRVTEEAAGGLGFALQTIQNLANAEAVLAEERRSGLISVEEYATRQEEIDTLQSKNAEYFTGLLTSGADMGAMMQALGDQLSFSGFSEDQITRINTAFNPDTLAAKFFEGKDFADLGKEQQQYVSEVFSRVMAGLTPDNIDERFRDVETTYKDIATSVVNSMINGSTEGGKTAAGNIDFQFNKNNISSFIQDRMGGGIPGSGRNQGISPEAMATNLLNSDKDLMKIGTDAMEVFTRLTEFTDQDLAKSIMSTEGKVKEFGETVSKLRDYEKINIELVYSQGLDPDTVVQSIKDLENISFNEDIFGKAPLDAEALVASTLEAGGNIEDLKPQLQQASNAIGSFGKDAMNKFGKIKPEIVPNILVKMFGNTMENPGEVANALNSVFPNGLDPITLALLVTLSGDPTALALLSNPNAIAAAQKGQSTFTETVSVDGERFRSQKAIPQAMQNIFAGTDNKTGSKEDKKDNTSGGGGGGAEKTQPFKEMLNSLMETLRLYTDIDKVLKDIKKKKISFEKGLQNLTLGGGIVGQLRKMNLSEGLIADILSKGAEEAQKILAALKKRGNATKVNAMYLAGQGAMSVSEKVGDARNLRTQTAAVGKLQGTGLSDEAIADITSNPIQAEYLMSLEKGSKAWNKYIESVKAASKANDEYQASLDPVQAAIDQFEKAREPQLAVFEFQEAKFQKAFGEIDRYYKPIVKKRQEAIKSLQKQIAAINGQIAALEKLNNADQMRIRSLERQKEILQRQIQALEYQNELDQRRIDKLRREDEMRSRVSDALSHELDIMSQQEEKIRQAHDKRVKALENVARINDRIIQQQRSQLSISQALSEGDIYAATAAAQDMEAQQVQFSQEQTRLALDQGMENQIAGLTTEGGLTRQQAEEQINLIKQQSYQTSLLIRDIEDKIYQRNQEMIPIKDSIYKLDLQIRDISDIIYDRETSILNLRNNQLAPLQAQLEAEEASLDNLNEEWDNKKANLVIDGMTYDQLQDKIDAEKEAARVVVAGIKVNGQMRHSVENLRKKWVDVTEQIAAAVRTAKELSVQAIKAAESTYADIDTSVEARTISATEGAAARASRAAALAEQIARIEAERDAKIAEYIGSGTSAISTSMTPQGNYAGGEIKNRYANGNYVMGSGGRDTVPALLTPGEFVVRKAMVDKYGIPMLSAINQGAFAKSPMPRFKMPKSPRFRMPRFKNIAPPVPRFNPPDMRHMGPDLYNTNNSVNVYVSGTNASAEEIANRTIVRLKELGEMKVKNNRASY